MSLGQRDHVVRCVLAFVPPSPDETELYQEDFLEIIPRKKLMLLKDLFSKSELWLKKVRIAPFTSDGLDELQESLPRAKLVTRDPVPKVRASV